MADREDRVRGACGLAIDVLADPDLTLSNRAADRRCHGYYRVELLRRFGLERCDFLVALAEDTEPAAHCVERNLVGADGVLCGDQVSLGLLPILERTALRQIEFVCALLGGLRHREL